MRVLRKSGQCRGHKRTYQQINAIKCLGWLGWNSWVGAGLRGHICPGNIWSEIWEGEECRKRKLQGNCPGAAVSLVRRPG
jgi:hypothetical protein